MKARIVLVLTGVLVMAFSAPALASVPPDATAKGLPALTPAPDDALSRALESGALSEAQYALARAEALFRPALARARYGDVQAMPPRAATLVLRDLALRQRELSAAEQERADGVLARPFSDESRFFPRPDDNILGFPPGSDPVQYSSSIPSDYPAICFVEIPVCVNFVTVTDDAIPLADSNGDQLPDYLGDVLLALDAVWDKEIVAMGFRQPKSDITSANRGVDGRLDIYLVDLPGGLYGYCTTDDPKLNQQNPPSWDVSAYCVFDNDYLPSEYGPGYTSEQNLQVTAAHEFFHAVQFAYDVLEDDWFMEGSATWVEDEVFDDVDQNREYLRGPSPLTLPGEPLDFDNPDTGWVYGTWIFFRYLTERGGAGLVNQFWNRAGGAPGDPDDYSLQAIDSTVKGGLARAFGDFSAANLVPSVAYEEGEFYPGAPFAASLTISRSRLTASRTVRIDHLASASVSVRPGVVPRNAKVKLTLDFPAASHDPQARVVSVLRNGTVQTRTVRLNRSGDAKVTLGFGNTRQVIVVAVNAGASYECWQGAPLACQGIPLDDGLPFKVRVTLVQSG